MPDTPWGNYLTTTATQTAEQMFASRGGELAFMAELAFAAYHLGPHETHEAGYNEASARANAVFNQLGAQIEWLEYFDFNFPGHPLPALFPKNVSGVDHFKTRDLLNGVFTRENAALIIGRSTDAVFLSFRGTNDAENPFANLGSPDMADWLSIGSHYALFADIMAALDVYLEQNPGLHVYVTGHSLGAGLADAFMTAHAGSRFSAVLFGGPGYGESRPEDGRITNVWVEGDAILAAEWYHGSDGDQNKIVGSINTDVAGFLLTEALLRHWPELYVAYARYFGSLGDFVFDASIDTILVNATLTDYENRTFRIANADDRLVGSDGVSELLIGGDGDDVLIGGVGADVLVGGADFDIAIFAGNRALYTINQGPQFTTVTGPDGTDTLYGVNRLQFADQYVDLFYSGVNLNGTNGIDELVGGEGDDTVSGNGGDDSLRGAAGADTLDGGVGNDTISGGAGNDVILNGVASASPVWVGFMNLFASAAAASDGDDAIDGGSGIDTSVYAFSSTVGGWRRNPDGTWTVTGVGTDTLTSVERLQFTDRTVALDLAQQTFSGNGTSDFLFRNSNHGTVVIWEMSGATQTSATIAGGAPSNWAIVGSGDINGDGRDDLIWRNNTDGGVAGWLMNGATATQVAMVGGAPSEWQFSGLGDFNADGRDDFVWRNVNTGAVAVWRMDGLTSHADAIIYGAPMAWSIAAIADFDGDGSDDILLRNSSDGALARWTTNGVTQTGAAIVGGAPVEWQVAGTGDFDGDGRADILLHNSSTGAISMWRMNGNSVAGTQIIGSAPTVWHVADVGDYNGDGRDDIVLRHDDGTIALWTMNGFSITNQQVIGVVPTDWVLS